MAWKLRRITDSSWSLMPDLPVDSIPTSIVGSSSGDAVSGRILVVDDQKLARTKLALAVKALGHDALVASSGKQALALLESSAVDLILLDILMPEQNGIEVLSILKAHPHYRNIPVVVISGLDDDTALAIEAIRLGAEDFLPKTFEPVLLRARINAGLRKKFNRDQELEELGRIRRLTDAAGLLEESLVTRERLELEDMVERRDSLGQLARVFTSMAEKIYERERRLRRQYQAMKGGVLLLLSGIVFGLNVPLSKVATQIDSQPLGYTLWANTVVMVLCLSIALFRRTLPTFSWPLLRFLLVWGIVGAVLGDLILFIVMSTINASTMSIIIVMEGFMVFAFAALIGQEKASLKRFAGLLVGLLGILMIVGSAGTSGTTINPWWALLALAVPLSYACENVYLGVRYPEGLDLIAGIGLSTLVASLLLVPIAWARNDLLAVEELSMGVRYALIGMALVAVVGNYLFIKVVQIAGSVFASQASYVIMIAGVAWSFLLLQERLSAGSVVAVCMMLVGLLLVEPKREPDEVLDVGVYGN